jgi:hypothetical protein
MLLQRRFQLQSVLLACGLAAALASCSSSSLDTINSTLPREMALPAEAPQRPETPPAFPAVHDMPPPRANATLSPEEQVRLEDDLVAVRARQEVATGAPAVIAKKKPAPAAPTPRIIPATSSNTIY